MSSTATFCGLMRQVDRIIELEGRCEGFLNWQGVINTAQRLRGQEIFVDLYEAPAACHHLFDIIATSIIDATLRLRQRQRESGVDHRFATLSNCSVNMISPEQYKAFLLPCDRRFAEAFDCVGIHNCAWTADPYLEHYASIPNLGYLDMGLNSDLRRARALLPQVRRAIMYTPMDLANKTREQVRADLEGIARDFAPCDIVIADVEAGTPDEKVRFVVDLCGELSRTVDGHKTSRHMRVTDLEGCLSTIEPQPTERTPQWAAQVSQELKADWSPPVPPGTPFFVPPIPFVIPPPEGAGEPFFSHNHCPALTWCANGDLLAAWFSTILEWGTEMTILASRLRAGAAAWDPAAEFFNAPDRNMTGTALFHDGQGTLCHFNGMGPEGAQTWENLALLLRTSTDNGVTWSPPRPISSGERYQRRHQVIAGTSVTPGGVWLQPCDATPGEVGGSTVHISRDGGRTWSDPGGDIRGIHAGVVGLKDGRLLAFGRGRALDGCMPISVSADLGKSWTCRPSPFPPIATCQRLVLLRLREGPLLLVSFTGANYKVPVEEWQGMSFTDTKGASFTGHGVFAALSFDEGETWPVRRLLTPGKGTYDGGDMTPEFTATPTMAEPRGYLAATQTPDGVVHLISSRLHYRFNLAWVSATEPRPQADAQHPLPRPEKGSAIH
ncbi:MAG: exo-alpha-sialidase [Planctomycetes bacterium]|nr:exo-alpha-sialidase [Planctomycetota bacterium]